MAFLTLSPEVIAHLVSTEVDELTPANEAQITKIKALSCRRCGSSLHPKLNQQTPFGNGALPRMLAHCDCGFTLDPETGFVVELGSATRVTESIPIIKP